MAARQQECGICMDSCKNPKLISCHHSFCYKCLDNYVRVNLRKGRFDCPICSTIVELPKGGVRCFETKSFTETSSDEKFACDLCGPKSVACSRCLDCEENLCQSCCYVHEKLKVSRHHKVSDLGTLDSEMKGKIRQRIFCDQHPEEEIKLMCRDCNKLICVLCKAVNHENHATKTVVDVAAELKKTLQTKMTSCSEKLKNISACKEKAEELERSIDGAEQEELKSVVDQRSHLNQLLVQEVTEVKAKIKNVYLSLRQQNAIFKRDVQDEFRTCSNVYENALMLTHQGSDIEIIKKGPALDQLISEAISKTGQMPNIRLNNKLFSPAEIKQSELSALIGKMQDSTDYLTKVGKSASDSPTTSMAILEIEKSLNDLIIKKDSSNKRVLNWIKEHVDEHTTRQGYFIRALMTAVCKSAVTSRSNTSMKVDKRQMQRRTKLLQKYLDHQANLELQALFALQALVHKLKKPPVVLRELFHILYNEDIVSEDAFIQREKSEDPREQEGKGVAMKQVVQFLTWLKEEDNDSDG